MSDIIKPKRKATKRGKKTKDRTEITGTQAKFIIKFVVRSSVHMTKTQAHKSPPQEKPRRDIVVVPRPIPLSSTNTHARTHARTRNPHPGPVRTPPPPPPVRAHSLPSLCSLLSLRNFFLLRSLASSFDHSPNSPRRCIVPTYLPTYQPSKPFDGWLQVPTGTNRAYPPTHLTHTPRPPLMHLHSSIHTTFSSFSRSCLTPDRSGRATQPRRSRWLHDPCRG